MKTRAEIEAILKRLKPELAKKFHVQEIGIFGSYARGVEREGSDVDILVRLSEPIGWEMVDLKDLCSHRQYKHSVKSGRVTIAGQLNHDLAPGTLNNIFKQAQLKQEK